MHTTTLADDFARNGFVIVDRPVVPSDDILRARVAMDEVVAGTYPTGVEPTLRHGDPTLTTSFMKVDMAHLCHDDLMAIATSEEIGAVAAEVTGAEMVQVWTTQLIMKPSLPGTGTALGWHQDDLYWHHHFEGEVFTCWVALDDVGPDSGPVTYVAGSHTWPVVEEADFRDHDLDVLKERLSLPSDATWEEHPAVLPAGGLGFHHKRTMHASRENTSGRPRPGFVLHLRTEKSTPGPGAAAAFHHDLDDHDRFPIMYRA